MFRGWPRQASADERRHSPGAAAPSWLRPLGSDGWFAVFALLHSASAFGFLLEPLDPTVPANTALWLLLYVVALGILCYHYKLLWLSWLPRHQPLLCAVLAIAAASWIWSVEPDFTWKRVTHLIGTTLIGLCIGYHFATRSLMAILVYSFAVLIAGNILVALVFPDLGQHSYGGAMVWQGLTSNRNVLGFLAAIATVLFVTGTLFGRIPVKVGVAFAAASILALVMTGSATAIVVVAVGLATVVIFVASKRIRAPSILTLTIVLVAGCTTASYIATSQYLYDFTEILGRDATFTRRTEIWAAAWDATLARPWLGNGYGTLWSATERSPFLDLSWPVVHAHNGFLHLTSQLGFPAGILAVGYVLAGLVRATRIYARRASPFALFALAFGLLFTVENITEVFLFEHRQLGWVLFVTLAVALARAVDDRRLPEPKPNPRRRS